jgi:putative Mn2+ efflux pump MntP
MSIDDLSVGVAYGLSKTRLSIKSLLIMLFGCMVASFGIMLASKYAFTMIPDDIAKYIMVAILGVLGIKMLYTGWKERKEDENDEAKLLEKVVRDDKSIGFWEKFVLGIGLGVGDFAQAIVISLVGIPIILAVILLQVGLIINVSIGNLIAYKGFAKKIKGKLSFLPGAVLILFALYELFF